MNNMNNLARNEIVSVHPFQCVREHKNAILPMRKRTSDAGYDLASVEDCVIKPGELVNVYTGWRIAPPEHCYYTIEGRSSLFAKRILVMNTIIDGGYTGKIYAMLLNVSEEPYEIRAGDRIAQLVPHQIIHLSFEEVDQFSSTHNTRGEAGFGSSGR